MQRHAQADTGRFTTHPTKDIAVNHYTKRPVTIEAITFDELVQHGRDNGANIVNGMPWSFQYKGHPISHERDDCYLIPTAEGTLYMTPEDMLITGIKGEIYPCKREIFEATYTPVSGAAAQVKCLTSTRITEEHIEDVIQDTQFYVFPGTTVTVCLLTLKNGAKVVGHNYGAIDVARQDWATGRFEARAMAVEKVWELEGYVLRNRLASI